VLRKLLGIINTAFEMTIYLLKMYYAFVKYLRNMRKQEAVYQLFLGSQ